MGPFEPSADSELGKLTAQNIKRSQVFAGVLIPVPFDNVYMKLLLERIFEVTLGPNALECLFEEHQVWVSLQLDQLETWQRQQSLSVRTPPPTAPNSR